MDLSDWLLVPGEWLFEHSGLSSLGAMDQDRGNAVVTLGLAFWIVLLLVTWRLWHVWRPHSTGRIATGHARSDDSWASELSGHAASTRAWLQSWTLREAWGWALRLQATHLIVFVAPTLAVVLTKYALFILFFPLTIMSFADQTGPIARLEPLDRPACWTFVSWCVSPAASFRKRTDAERAACGDDKRCAESRVALPDRAQPYFKLAWVLLAMAWIGTWRRRAHPAGASPTRP